jgi:hypothetical protein
MRLAPAALAALATAALAPVDAAGAQRQVVVSELRTEGLDEAARAFFLAGVIDGVESTGAGLVAPNTLAAAVTERPDLERCEDDPCWLALARSTRADAVVAGKVTKEAVRGERERARYTVRLSLYDAHVADFTSIEEDACTRCSETEQQALLRTVAKRLFERERHPEVAPLEVTSQPTGGEVRLDGRLLGLTDLSLSVATGAHMVAVEKRGLPPAKAEFALAPGRAWRVSVRWDGEAAPSVSQGEPPSAAPPPGATPPAPPVETTPQHRLQRPIGIALAAVGAALVITGITLLALNHQGTCSDPAPIACPNRYNFTAGGATALAGGVLAAGGGLTMILLRARF